MVLKPPGCFEESELCILFKWPDKGDILGTLIGLKYIAAVLLGAPDRQFSCTYNSKGK